MAAKVSRRDFLNGVAIGAGALMLPGCSSDTGSSAGAPAATQTIYTPPPPGTYYPPALTGMRGSHEGSYEVAHALAWRGEKPASYTPINEHYDLVVVGAGMSGLAAAQFYRSKMGPDVHILVLDNHDDFGGHAKRNEFHRNGRMVVSLGGAQNLENAGDYSAPAKGLMEELGIDQAYLDAMDANTPSDFVLAGNFAANVGLALPGEAGHTTVTGEWMRYPHGADGYEAAIRQLPLATEEQDKLISFFGGGRDYLSDMSLSEKWDYVKSVSYNTFLVERVGLSQDTLAILDCSLLIYVGVTGWNLSVLEAVASGSPGSRAMGWLGRLANAATLTLLDDFLEVRMFPDGNASVARLLVQKLIPAVAPDLSGPDGIATALFDYLALDRPDQPTRIRLNSTVVGVSESDKQQINIDYVQHGSPLRVTADHCILACYNGIIPHLCPQLPEPQKEALSYGVKIPFVYANVLLRNGMAFDKLDASLIQCPTDPFQMVSVAPNMAVGGYTPPRGPADPTAVFMMGSPTPAPQGTESVRDLLRLGRVSIYSTPFATYEEQIREQLQALLGVHGFDHENDILAITVNRIPHGYAYPYFALEDPEWQEGQAPHEIGRAQFGRISIANTDSEARAYMDAAFDAAWRAVEEQTRGV